jgi:hypothetical protein
MPKHVQLSLPNDAVISIETDTIGGERDVGVFDLEVLNIEALRKPIQGLAEFFKTTLEKIKPDKGAIEFGIELGLESGQLTTLLVKGAGKAHVKITLEWSNANDKPSTHKDKTPAS